MRHTSVAAIAFAASAALSGVASADLVTVQCTGVGAGRSVSVTHLGTVRSVFAGQILLTLTNSTSGTLNGSWRSFCTELSQYIYINGAAQSYQVLAVKDVPVPGPSMGQVRADAIGRMYTAAAAAQYGTDADFAAAFQIAVWEVANDYDGTQASLNLAAGNLQGPSLSAAVITPLTTLLAAAADTTRSAAQLFGIGNASFQDQILDPASAIPTPGSVVMLGLAGLVGFGRRRK